MCLQAQGAECVQRPPFVDPLFQISYLNSEIKVMHVAAVDHYSQITNLSLPVGEIFKNILLTSASEHSYRSVAASTVLNLIGPTIREH